ncbi:MAG TPA: tetratricopeptide repeat protein [Calditrichia bacterium]|nr:tetratricopeptide repeat protein [Calditrichia bacterium]
MGPEAKKMFLLGFKAQMEGRLEEAIDYYQQSLDLEETAEAYTFLGWTYSYMGLFEKAIDECKKAIDIDPDFGNPYNDIGSYLIQLQRPDEAIGWLQQAKEAPRYQTPEYAYCNTGKALEQKRLWPLALREYQEALRLRPGYEPAQQAIEELNRRLN